MIANSPYDGNIHAIVNSYANGTYSAHSIMLYFILLYLVEPISLTLFTLLCSTLLISFLSSVSTEKWVKVQRAIQFNRIPTYLSIEDSVWQDVHYDREDGNISRLLTLTLLHLLHVLRTSVEEMVNDVGSKDLHKDKREEKKKRVEKTALMK